MNQNELAAAAAAGPSYGGPESDRGGEPGGEPVGVRSSRFRARCWSCLGPSCVVTGVHLLSSISWLILSFFWLRFWWNWKRIRCLNFLIALCWEVLHFHLVIKRDLLCLAGVVDARR